MPTWLKCNECGERFYTANAVKKGEKNVRSVEGN